MKILYHNLYTHFIFVTQDKSPIISEQFRIRIEKYITGIVNKYESRLYSIFANPEHVHFLVSRSPKISESTLATKVADGSQDFINENNLCQGKFAWQQSASAFSVSKKDVNRVCKYILNQGEHHKKITFTEEYEKFIDFYNLTLSLHR